MGLLTLKRKAKILGRGLKRMVIALFTAFLFALSVYAFVEAATAIGYWSVILFLSAVVLLVWAFGFLHAMGISDAESKGDHK